MAKQGSKGKYRDWLTEEGLLLLKSYVRDGFTDKEIADKIGINHATFYDWKKRFPAFSDTLKAGRMPVNVTVENTFFTEKLQSRTVKERTKEIITHKDAKGKIVGTTEHEKITEKFIPADTTAMIFYLKCRMPDKYNDKINLEIDTKKDGRLADLIDGLKEDIDDLHKETAGINEAVADEQP